MSSAQGQGAVGLALFLLSTGGWLLYRGLKLLRVDRLVARMQTTKVRDLKPGFVELAGKAAAFEPMKDPVLFEPCAYFRIRVEERRGAGKYARWVEIYRKASGQPILLDDGTGKVAILPEGAERYLDQDIKSESGTVKRLFTGFDDKAENFMMSLSTRTTETVRIRGSILRPGDALYVLGWAFKATDRDPLVTRAAARVKLTLQEAARMLKADKARMAALDADKDSVVDETEWTEGLRRYMLEMENKLPAERETLAPYVIRHGGGPLIISDKSEEAFGAHLAKRGWLQTAGGMALLLGALTVLWHQL